ncbi:MAG: single-stranded DNA-binding protein [Helicobacteraceae bacterium]|nr:single-stranded DNA-binding protein [Helicobacteraceae bacterium]
MFNKVIIVGNLTRDVELKYLPSGSAAATIGLASNRKFKKQDGTMADETCFVDVKLFGRTAEVANQYLKKGSQILIEGRLVLETWNDATGAKRNKHSIMAENMQMLGKAQNNDTSNYNENNSMQDYHSQDTIENRKNIQVDINEDEIPF